MDNPETMTILDTQDEDKENIKTQHNTENSKDEQCGPQKNQSLTQMLAKSK